LESSLTNKAESGRAIKSKQRAIQGAVFLAYPIGLRGHDELGFSKEEPPCRPD